MLGRISCISQAGFYISANEIRADAAGAWLAPRGRLRERRDLIQAFKIADSLTEIRRHRAVPFKIRGNEKLTGNGKTKDSVPLRGREANRLSCRW